MSDTHHAAKVPAYKDMVEGRELEVGGPQVPGELQALAVGDTAAPVRRTQGARAGGTLI